MRKPTFLAEWDWGLFLSALALSAVSLIAMRSAAASVNPGLFAKQAVWVTVGVAACVALSAVPYPRLIDGAMLLYPLAVLSLAFVLVAGTVKLGASRWVTIFGFSLQPSELAKLACACLAARAASMESYPIGWRGLALSAGLVGLPAVLVFMQPDLGTSTIFAAIWLGVVWAGGLSRKVLLSLSGGCLALLPLGWLILKDYQRSRLLVFINPDADPLGAGYTIIQSRIAIGSGQLFGRGWMSGTQNQLSFLPERHSDFLYSVVGEEWGFLGSLTVVALFAYLIWRMIRIALDNSDSQGRLLAVGLASWVAYQAVVNMGMVMGVVPVVGVPLPMLSYGGSAMVTTWMAIGCLQSIRRFGTRF